MMGDSIFSPVWRYFKGFLSDKEESQESTSKESGTNDSKNGLRLVRVIDRTIHVSPLDRRKEVDYVITNPTNEEYNFVFLPLRKFERNLEVFDEDDRKLNIYPNRVVKGWERKLKSENYERWEKIEHRFKHTKYKLLIQLPRDNPLKPGDYRTIKLTFEQSDSVQFHKITDPTILKGWLNKWYRKFFRIPTFVVDVERFPGHPHDIFIKVIGPPGYRVAGDDSRTDAELTRELHKDGLNDDTRVVSTRLPPPKNNRYNWDLDYELIPNHEGLMKGLVVFFIFASLTGLASIGLSIGIFQFGHGNVVQSISGGFVTAILGIIFALDYDWANRYRIVSVLPLLIHGIAWALWQIG